MCAMRCYWSIFSNFPNFIKIATTLLPTNCDLDNTTCYSIPMTTCFFNFLLLLSLLPSRLTLNKKNDLFCNEMMLTTIKDVLTKGLPIWYHLNNPNKLAAEKKEARKAKSFPLLLLLPLLPCYFTTYLLPSHSCTRLLQLKFYDDNTNAYTNENVYWFEVLQDLRCGRYGMISIYL